MLSSLHVRNYVLIDSLDISFPGGLIIITGQTGAGKSILLGALSLVLGSKTDASVIGPKGDSCVVEAEFKVDGDNSLRALVEGGELDWDGGNLVIRRTLSRTGRSRCFVNDEPVTVGFLGELSARLLDIHSQHQTLLLSRSSFQMEALDRRAGNGELLDRCSSLWNTLSDDRKRLEEVSSTLAAMEAQRDYDEAVFRQLSDAKLEEGELETLENEQKVLSNAEDIKETLWAAQELLSPSGEGRSVVSSLKEAGRLLEKVSTWVGAAGELSERISSSRIEIDDIVSSLEEANAAVEVSPQRLAEVEERISMLYSLMKRHGCSGIGELIAVRDALDGKLHDSSRVEEERDALVNEISRLEKEHSAICDRLHEKRVSFAGILASETGESLKFLELEKSVFRVDVTPAPAGPSGADQVTFFFSASGKAPVELSKCASGGELSRIMLSLKAMMARYSAMPTLFFDEIDTGVSGSAADRMGSMICSMGETMQVFAITHLPQVAAKGSAHYLVEKDLSGGDAVTSIRPVSGEDRVMEIARMLSGASITPAAVENARSLMAFRP
jgi:DNA repair protein RecN (Recombination protein N)